MTYPQTEGSASMQKNCSACNTPFSCGGQAAEKSCWCESLLHVGPIAGPESDCLCPTCLANNILKVKQRAPLKEPPGPVIEGVDFYWEGAAMVFTAAYLRRRGYCCENGCRHCPYGT